MNFKVQDTLGRKMKRKFKDSKGLKYIERKASTLQGQHLVIVRIISHAI